MKLIHLYLLPLVLTLNMCSDSNDGELFDFTNAYYWDQTLCSDPWGTGQNDTNEETSKALKEFLMGKGITVSGIVFKDIREEGVLTCQSCGCFTWMRIIVGINESHRSSIEALGFTRYEEGQ